MMEKNIEGVYARRERIVRDLRNDPAKVLFGSKAKRVIAKRFIIAPDRGVSLKDIKKNMKASERDLITAFKDLTEAEILTKKREGRTVYYYINDRNIMGIKYRDLLVDMSGIIVASTELEEKKNSEDYY